MKKYLIYILLIIAAPGMHASDTILVKEVFGLRPVKGVKVTDCPWLHTDVFLGMTLDGDSLFYSAKYLPELDESDMEAGENDMLREKFRESRQVLVTNFLNEKNHKTILLKGDVNSAPQNGGLVLRPGSKSGLMPELSYSLKKSQLYYVDLKGNTLRVIRPWEGNSFGEYVYSPGYIQDYRRMVFVGEGNGYDLYLWDSKTGHANPFKYNSPADEKYPYVYNDSILFFSSDRIEPGNFDLFYYNFRTDDPPRLFFPKQLQTRDNELAIVFKNDSVSLMAVENKKGISYKNVHFNLGEEPVLVNEIPDSLLEPPANDVIKIYRELGKRAKEMFFVNYGERLIVEKPEDIFTDSIKLNKLIVRAIQKVMNTDNIVDVSFLLPVEFDDPEFQSDKFSLDEAMAIGVRKIAQLMKDIDGSSSMIIGFAAAPGGQDLNMMRSYFQANTFKMQLTEYNDVPEENVHVIAAGDYIQSVKSDLGVKGKNNVGVVYLYKNRKVPEFLAAYKLQASEDRDIVAQRFGISTSTMTYAELMIKPFLEVPDDVIFLPVKDITMVWKGNDLKETAKDYNVSLSQLLKVNGLTEEINDRQRILYIP
ncbi:hypothetical protein [Saccharicrinis sp. FJH54]|uniref:hypothetical protein n=1 Tax=Saccharicrinis sp. FJH54 TaxID=3344665 RepID=UPI0035D4EB78